MGNFSYNLCSEARSADKVYQFGNIIYLLLGLTLNKLANIECLHYTEEWEKCFSSCLAEFSKYTGRK